MESSMSVLSSRPACGEYRKAGSVVKAERESVEPS